MKTFPSPIFLTASAIAGAVLYFITMNEVIIYVVLVCLYAYYLTTK